MRPAHSLPALLLLALAARAADPLPPGAVARFGTAPLRHEGIGGEDSAFVFRPDGRAVASRNVRAIRLWDAADGRRLWEFDAGSAIKTFTFSADGKRLAVVAADGVVLVDAATGRAERTLKAPGRCAAAFAPDGRTLATCRDDWGQPVELWDPATGARSAELTVEKHGKPQALGYSPDGAVLTAAVWGTRDGSAVVWAAGWDTATRDRRANFDPQVQMSSYRLSPDGRRLATRTAADSDVTVWDVAAGKAVARIELGYGRFNFGADGSTVVTSAANRKDRTTTVAVWDAGPGKRRREFTIPGEMGEEARVSPDGTLAATSRRGHMLCLWHTATGKRVLGGTAHDDQVTGLAFALGGTTLISRSGDDVRTWDAGTGARLGTLPAGTLKFGVLPGGRELLGTAAGLRRIDIATGKPVGEPLARPALTAARPGETFETRTAVGTADGRSVVALGLLRSAKDVRPYVVVWDLRTGRPTAEFVVPGPPAETLSADGRVVAGPATTTRPNPDEKARHYFPSEHLTDVTSLDALTGRALSAFRVPDEYRFHLELTADGQSLAVVTSRHGAVPAHPPVGLTVRLFEVRTGRERRAITLAAPGHYDPATVALSADGRLVAVSRLANRVEVYDAATGRELVVRAGYESAAYTLAFRADGRRLATGHTDGSVLVWDLPTPTAVPVPSDGPALDAAWADLTADDADRADAASWALAGSPAAGTKLLADRLKPADPAVAERARKRVADLDSPSFQVREAAGRELAGLVEIADPLLQTALRGKLSDEQSARLKRVLEPPAVVRSPELLATLRGIETLERIGSPDAAAVLRHLADGPPELRPTREARAALDRLTARAAGK